MGFGLALLLSFLPPLPAAQDQDATIAVNVNLVVLAASAHDRSGNFVSGLEPSDFHIWEDGRPQTVTVFRHEDLPVSVGLVIDNSRSMRHKRHEVTSAALAFVRSSNPKDEMFVVNFNERVSLGLPEGKAFSGDPVELEAALNRNPPDGMTALYDAIDSGLQHVKQSSLDKKVLIVVSDGGDNASHRSLDDVLDEAARSNAIIYTIGLFDPEDADRNPGVLRRIAKATGGQAYFPDDPRDVTSVCERIAADIRQQYTLGYTPTNPRLDDTYRTIRVTATRAHGGKIFVRTRAGYIAASPGKPSLTAGRHHRP